MAQYYQVVEQSDKPTPENLQTLYPNIIENQPNTVRYVIGSDDHTLQQNQPILVTASDQYMLLNNVLDPNAVALQNSQFDMSQPQIYYMETDESVKSADTMQQQPSVILNHQLPVTTVSQLAGSSQKVIMLQQPQQSNQATVLIQQPSLVQRQILPSIQISPQKTVQTRIQSPLLTLNTTRAIGQSPLHTARAVAQSPLHLPNQSPRNIQPQGNKVNLLRAGMSRQPVPKQNVLSDRPPPLVRTGSPMNRFGVSARPSIRSVTPGARLDSPRPTMLNSRPALQNAARNQAMAKSKMKLAEGELGAGTSTEDKARTVTLEDGSVLTAQQYQLLLQKRAEGIANTPRMGTSKNPPKLVTRRPPAKAHARNSPLPGGIIPTPGQPKPPVNPPHQVLAQQQLAQQKVVRANADSPQPRQSRIVQLQNQENMPLPAVLRNFVPPPEIRDIISKTQDTYEFQNSIRMFVLLKNGEQRLITFTMPKEDCTIQEILEQVGVPLQHDTKIAISETNKDGINLVVTVGISDDDEVPGLEDMSAQPAPAASNQQPPTPPSPSPSPSSEPPKAPTPELAPPEPELPRYIPGMLAVCTHCGFLSDDFNKCIRCKRKLPDGIKAVPSNVTSKTDGDRPQKPTIAINLKSNGIPKTPTQPIKRRPRPKPVEQEPVILTLSSDDEDEEEEKINQEVNELLKKADSTASECVLKEPSINDIKDNMRMRANGEDMENVTTNEVSISIECRTIRIGSYRFTPEENVVINNKEVIIKVPNPKNPKDVKTITIERRSVVRVLVHLQKMLPVMFYYVSPEMAESIRQTLEMTEGSEPYFDPLSDQEAYKRVTLLPEVITEELRGVFKVVYGAPFNLMDELNPKEANTILIRTCPKEIAKNIQILSQPTSAVSEVRQLLIYPPGKGGLPINTEDYFCLAQDQFLNDVIIDFYLKYLVLNMSAEEQKKVHVFSTFFYKRLTSKPAKPSRRSHPTELDPTLTAAQKRHFRVKNWTKNVNLFEKDYVVVPINENAHWFLAIICFPGMEGPHTFDGKPHKLEHYEKKKKVVTHIGNVTITQVKVEKTPPEDGELSDKDEAEGDDSELESGEESEGTPVAPVPATVTNKLTRVAIKQPCILIFDSLAGASRSRVVATLRDYLTCEYKVKMGSAKVYNKDIIKGACPKVPQQTNYTDCGLYLLQYVEEFFKNPIKDYHIPINELKNWFEEIVVTRKREEISILIKQLMVHYKKDIDLLPYILFPTLNGELVEHPPEEDEEEEEEEDEEPTAEDEAEDFEKMNDENSDQQMDSEASNSSPIKSITEPSNINDGFIEETPDSPPLPDSKQVSVPNTRDAMSYLKAKRIIRHKPNENSDAKKPKLSTD